MMVVLAKLKKKIFLASDSGRKKKWLKLQRELMDLYRVV